VKHAGLRTVMRTLSPAKHHNLKYLGRSPVYPVAVLFLCVQFLGACSSHKADLAAEQQQNIRDNLSRLESSIATSGQQSQDAMNGLSARVDKLEARLQTQQAQIDALSASLEGMKMRKKIKQHRKKKPVPKVKASPVTRVTPIQAPSKPEPVAAPVANPEAEKNAYTSAYLALKSGRYEEASKGFSEQLKNFADGEYADQAWYWLGESQFAQQTQKAAIASFQRVANNYPASVKHAAALLKLGQIYQTLNQPKQASRYFNRLIKEHPDSTAAEQARSALAGMKSKPSKREK